MLDGHRSKCRVGSNGGGGDDGGSDGGSGGGEAVSAAMDEQPQVLACVHS